MAKPTNLQRYYLFQIGWMRWFGLVFAGTAVLITASNLPWLTQAGDLKQVAVNVAGGLAFVLIGLAMYRVGSFVQRCYRAHIAAQPD